MNPFVAMAQQQGDSQPDTSGQGQAPQPPQQSQNPFYQMAAQQQSPGQPQPSRNPFVQMAQQQSPAPQPQYGMIHNAVGSLMANAGDPLANFGIRAANKIGLIGNNTAQQLINQPGPFTYDPNSIAGKVGGAVGQAVPIMASGPLAPATAFVSAGEQERERVQPDVSKPLTGGQTVDVLAQGALQAVLSKLMPGQKGSQAIIKATPELENAALNMMKNMGVQAGVSFTEGDAYNAVGNAIRKVTGQPAGSMNPLSSENLQAGLTQAAAGTGLAAAHEVAGNVGQRFGEVPTISADDMKALLLPDQPKGPPPPPEPSPAGQAGGLNLTAYQQAADHAANLSASLRQISDLQDQQIAHYNELLSQKGLQTAPAADEMPATPHEAALQRAQAILDEAPKFQPIPASEGPTSPGEFGTSTPLPKLLENATAKVRLPQGSENPSVPMDFEHPYDKAAYLAGNARGGKLATAANDYLTSEGFQPDEIKDLSGQVQTAAAAHAQAGKDTPLPAVYSEGAGKEQSVDTPQQVQTPKTLPAWPVRINPPLDLGNYTDRLYAEIGPEKAAELLDKSIGGDILHTGFWTANTPDLALGQGANKGIHVELDPTDVRGQPEIRKPASKIMWDQGQAEFHTRPGDIGSLGLTRNVLNSAVRKISFNPDELPTDRTSKVMAARMNNFVWPGLEKAGWQKTVDPDGTITYLHPSEQNPKPSVGETGNVQTNRTISPGPDMRRRTGMVQVPEAVGNFVEQDVRPKLDEAVDGIKSSWNGFKNFFGLQSGDEATTAKNTLRGRQAELTQRVQAVRAAFGKVKEYFDTKPADYTRQFIDDVENGRPVSNPAEQPIADAMREMLDNRRDQLVNRGWLDSFIENYFPHLWEEKEKAANVFSKTPMAGGKGFLKARTYPTMQEGIDAGLTPLYENPVEAFMARVHQMDKFITAQDAFKSMQDDGLLQQKKATDPTAEGYARIDDSIAKTYIKPTSKGGLNLAQRFDAPQAVASVINNYTSPALRSKAGSYLLDKAIGFSNVMNSVQLGLSPFHATFTSSNAILTKLATGYRQLLRADLPGAAKSLLTAPIAPIEYYRTGSKIYNEWMKPGSTDPQTAQYVQWLKDGGGRVSLDSHYDNNFRARFKEALAGQNPIGATIRAPFAGLEALASPIMDYVVPRMKLGAFLDEARENLARLPDDASVQDHKSALGNAWDSADNRFGQVTYDNIFWNQLAKGIGMATTRSLGWNLGTFRELGGGIGDVAGGVKDLAKGAAKGLLTGNGGEDISSGLGKLGTGRAAYTTVLPALTMGLTALAQRALYGISYNPKDLWDAFVIHTGKQDEHGHEITQSVPTYMKDAIGFAKHPLSTLEHKASPALAAAIELINNKDYRGAEIRNPDDSYLKQAGQLADYAGTTALPFSVSNVIRGVKAGKPALGIASALGLTRNPAEWGESEAEQTAHEILSDPDRHNTPENEAKYDEKTKLIEAMHNAPVTQRRMLAVQALHAGTISSLPDVMKMSAFDTPLERSVARMVAEGRDGVDDAFKVWDKATPDEQAQLKPIISKEINNSKTLTFSQKQLYRAKLMGKETANAS